MLKTLEKSWPIISIVFTLTILASLFFWLGATRLLSLLVMGLGILAIVTFTVRRHIQAHRQGRITRPVMRRNIVVDLLGILITMVLVIASTSLSTSLVAGRIGAYAGQMAGKAWGVTAGILLVLSLSKGLACWRDWLPDSESVCSCGGVFNGL